jgi:hypothetical protein
LLQRLAQYVSDVDGQNFNAAFVTDDVPDLKREFVAICDAPGKNQRRTHPNLRVRVQV